MGALEHMDPADRVLTYVSGLAGSYACPDLAAVQFHLSACRIRLRKIQDNGNHAPMTAQRLTHDIELLLDRGWWLSVAGPGSPECPDR